MKCDWQWQIETKHMKLTFLHFEVFINYAHEKNIRNKQYNVENALLTFAEKTFSGINMKLGLFLYISRILNFSSFLCIDISWVQLKMLRFGTMLPPSASSILILVQSILSAGVKYVAGQNIWERWYVVIPVGIMYNTYNSEVY